MFFHHRSRLVPIYRLSSARLFIVCMSIQQKEIPVLCDIPSNERSNDVREMVGRGILLRRTFPMAQVHTHTHNEVPRGMGHT